MDLDLDYRDVDADGVTVVAAKGELNIYTAPRLRELVKELVAAGHCVLAVDLEQADFIDSDGWGVLTGARKRATAHDGDLVLVTRREYALRHLAVSGLVSFLRVHATVEDAVAAITGTGVAG